MNILLVDDDPNILSGFKRTLKKQFKVETAEGGPEGLKLLNSNGPFSVVISDFSMPGMNGIEFLAQVRETAPKTVRMMLTGNADLGVSMDAVNEGNIFRFLTKPCTSEVLTKNILAGIEQYRLLMAEKDLLENTLSGSVKVLTDILSLTSPIAFGHAARVRKIMAQLAELLGVESAWEFELAGMLSLTGCVILPTDTVEKIYDRHLFNAVEEKMFESHPKVGHDLIENIPRLEAIADIILYQAKDYNGEGTPNDGVKEQNIPLGARALHAANDYDVMVRGGTSGKDAIRKMNEQWGKYDPEVLKALANIVKSEAKYEMKSMNILDLVTDMVLAEDVRSNDGLLLVAKGQSVTNTLKERLRNFARAGEVSDLVNILVPEDTNSGFVA